MNNEPDTFPTLITERLTLRRLSKNDSEAILQLRSNPEINKFLDRTPSETLGDALDFINSINDEGDGLFYWAITKTGADQLIGTICLFDFSSHPAKCEMGYELLTEYQGQGLMMEAASKVIEYAIETLGQTMIDALTHKDNQNSTKLLQKLHFKKWEEAVYDNRNLVLFRLRALSDQA